MGRGKRENSACFGPILHMLKGILFLLASCERFANLREFFKALRLGYMSQVVKLSLCLIKRHSIKSCGGMEV